MKKISAMALTTLVLIGCASMLPPIQKQHPNGFSKLIIEQPECQNTTLKNYNACLTAAKLMESAGSEQVTVKFISHWEETAFGLADRKQQVGESRLSPRDAALESSVWEKVKNDGIQATERIVVPILKKIYSESGTNYSNKMLKQTDLIELKSKSSLGTFREIHTELLKTAL